MIVFLAGGQLGWSDDLRGHPILVSFAEKRQCKLIDELDSPSKMLDSGAFAAWTSGRVINIEEYCDYIDQKKDLIQFYIALDVIPGKINVAPSEKEVSDAVEQSVKNVDYMMSRGLKPIPVFHESDPDWVLEKYVSDGHELIALGATRSRGKPEIVHWLLPIFRKYPKQKFHGLGMTQKRIIEHFPFFSVDSTSWLNFARYGPEANLYLLKGRSSSFNRRVGIMAINDLKPCQEDWSATIGGQLDLFFDAQSQ
jgi:hypothetical protein